MPQLHRLALEQLIQLCSPAHPAACRELLRRALCDNSERAWAAVLPHLRTVLLRRIYAQRPEINPQGAERLLFRTLAEFLAQLLHQPNLAQHFPSYPTMLATLDKILAELLGSV